MSLERILTANSPVFVKSSPFAMPLEKSSAAPNSVAGIAGINLMANLATAGFLTIATKTFDSLKAFAIAVPAGPP